MGCAGSKPGEVESWIDVDEKIEADDWVFSPNQKLKLMLRKDGNCVLIHEDKDIWWQSNTVGSGATHMTLKKDGNFVLLKGSEEVWELGARGGNKLWVEDNGYVGVYDGDTAKVGLYEEWLKPGEYIDRGDWIWSNNGEYYLSFDEDGDVCLYDHTGKELYDLTESVGSNATQFTMQEDGNLVLSGPSGVVWASNTHGSGATEVWVEDNGKITLWDASDNQVKAWN